MSLKRKLVAGGAVLLLAGGATGAGLAASGHGRSVQPVRAVRLAGPTRAAFLQATAQYLGTDVATLRHEKKSGQTLAEIANATPGRSADQLASSLVHAATVWLTLNGHRSVTASERRGLHGLLRHRITGFLTDTCPLRLANVSKHLGGCKGMRMM